MTAKSKPSVRITAGAERDLAGIWRRRRGQRGAEGRDGANALLDRIVTKIESLSEFQMRGSVPPELEPLGIRSYQELSLPPFRIIYQPRETEAGLTEFVVVVADARRDFRALLEERLLREN